MQYAYMFVKKSYTRNLLKYFMFMLFFLDAFYKLNN